MMSETVSECVECGSMGNIHFHHTNYNTDETVPVCASCHRTIHANQDHELYPVGRPEMTQIQVTEPTADELHERKRRGESYDDVINRLLEETQ